MPFISLQTASSVQQPPNHKFRQWLVGSTSAIAFGGSFVFLNKAWYQDYPRTSFHFFNDAGEWLQMDKAGHAWTAYTSSRLLYGAWRWAGLKNAKAVLLSTLTSFGYMASIEYLDGRSAGWGWSWGDIAGNTLGVSLFAMQQLGWKEQQVQLKFSAHVNKYDASLKPRADELFERSLPALLLKDYNAQTYWLSVNLKSVLPQSKLPAWLNVAAGYGAEGMWGGFENKAFDKNGVKVFDRTDVSRRRQWYLAPDIDLTKIRTKSKALRTVFFALNSLKVPLPALEFSSGKWSVHALSF
ncbi:MAG TPA: DUF2279 domain-containing protein [Flavisolibacter sp.]|nr:DUF2279 domain-containing protein [Flavisolibacter sp.]